MKKSSRILFPTRCFLDASSDLDFGVEDIDEELDIEEFVFEDIDEELDIEEFVFEDIDEELDIEEFVFEDSVLSILIVQFR